jgi:acyl-CoA dehydrogenase
VLIFPTGLPFYKPTDALEHKVSQLIQRPSEARDRLTQGVYLTNKQTERVAQLEQALAAVVEAAPIEKTLRQAKRAGQLQAIDDEDLLEEAISLGILNRNDQEKLLQARQLRNQVIQVNAFQGLGGENRKSGNKVSLLDRLGVA